jgi:hypothetical protein
VDECKEIITDLVLEKFLVLKKLEKDGQTINFYKLKNFIYSFSQDETKMEEMFTILIPLVKDIRDWWILKKSLIFHRGKVGEIEIKVKDENNLDIIHKQNTWQEDENKYKDCQKSLEAVKEQFTEETERVTYQPIINLFKSYLANEFIKTGGKSREWYKL